MNLVELTGLFSELSETNRPIRLRLSSPKKIIDDVLLVKRLAGHESLCGGFEYQLLCLSTNARLPLKELIAVPVEIQLVTDRRQLRSICGIVAKAASGEYDGGLASYQLIIRDALALMEQRTNTRVFRDTNEVEVSARLIAEWRAINPILAKTFIFDPSGITKVYPNREFIMQQNESDAAFLRRLWKRQGISWFVRHGESSSSNSHGTPAHTLVLFDRADRLSRNAAGTVQFNIDMATRSTDSVFSFGGSRTLSAGGIMRQSWDYTSGGMMLAQAPTTMKQGESGNQFAYSLEDYIVEAPHVGDSMQDYYRLGELRIQRHEYDAKCFYGESSVRDFCVGEWIELEGHPEIDTHPKEQREFVITELSVIAENNLPKTIDDRVRRLFATNRWGVTTFSEPNATCDERKAKYTNRFTCVRRGIPLVPAYDPRRDLPQVTLQSAIVVGPPGEEIHCDARGRVKLRFPGTREQDHVGHPGASNTDADSAWVRVASHWAGDRWGSINLPRVGDEVLVDFLGGDPDKPVIIGSVFGTARTPSFSQVGTLPGNRSLAGIKSKEIKGHRYNQLRLDDTSGQISSQLACEHGHSELNLGWLSQPRVDGVGKARGEGAELRSDQAVAIRGKGGVLISAEEQERAGGAMLQRDALIGSAEILRGIQQQLSELSTTHLANATETTKLDSIIRHLETWDAGSNVNPTAVETAPALVAISGPDGIAMNSGENLLIGSQSHADLISAGNSQITAGRSFLVRAAEVVSIFAYRLGLKLVAASGKIEVQSHTDDIEITSAKRIVLSAADEIILQAPQVRIVSKGAQINVGNNTIVQQCSENHTIKSKKFAHVTGGGGNLTDLKLPKSEIKTDERIVLFEQQTGLPIKNRHYRAVLEDGHVLEGITDAEGRTELMQSTTIGEVEISIAPHEATPQ
jgi:type VI secretion system secreted protein VgrG